MATATDLEFVKTAIMVVNLFGTVGVALWAWLRGPSEANTKRLGALEEDVDMHRRDASTRLQQIEGRLQFIPTVTELGELQADMRELKSTQASFHREMHQARESLTRIEDFLLRAPR